MNAPLRTGRRPALAIALALLLAACGGKKGTLTVKLVVPVNDDPFAGAASVHIRAGDPPFADQTVMVSNGHFGADLAFKPPSGGVGSAIVLVEALDGSGAVVGRGRTPAIPLQTQDATITVVVAPDG